MRNIYIEHPDTSSLTIGFYNLYNSGRNNIVSFFGGGFEATQITRNIYLGSIDNVYNPEVIIDKDIRLIISCIQGFVPPEIPGVEFIVIHCLDSPDALLLPIFDEIYREIEKCKHNILIHCMAGRSRSATILLAYLIRKYRIDTNRALETIQSVRPICPNEGFIKQLNTYSKE